MGKRFSTDLTKNPQAFSVNDIVVLMNIHVVFLTKRAMTGSVSLPMRRLVMLPHKRDNHGEDICKLKFDQLEPDDEFHNGVLIGKVGEIVFHNCCRDT